MIWLLLIYFTSFIHKKEEPKLSPLYFIYFLVMEPLSYGNQDLILISSVSPMKTNCSQIHSAHLCGIYMKNEIAPLYKKFLSIIRKINIERIIYGQ